MSGDLIKVRLSGPAKVGARWLKAGEEAVTVEEKEALEAEGLIEAGSSMQVAAASTDSNFQAAVAAEARKIAGAAFDGELGRIEAKLKEIMTQAEAEVAAANVRAEAAEGERDALQSRVVDLEAQLKLALENRSPVLTGEAGADPARPLSGAAPADQNTPPSEKAAKTAPKKGAAATTKG
ncbi:hypothetical protein MASR2M74_03030 [Paracoccaceae bacterium]